MRAKFACGHVQGHARSHVTSIKVKVIHGQMVMITPGTSHSKDMQQSRSPCHSQFYGGQCSMLFQLQ